MEVTAKREKEEERKSKFSCNFFILKLVGLDFELS
jgi:hypothetical protein